MSSSTNKVNPNDIISVKILENDDKLDAVVVDDDGSNSIPRESVDNNVDRFLTPFELAAQTLYDELRKAYNLDPSGKLRAVAVLVTEDLGKTWIVKADSTEAQTYKDQEQWSKVYVESEVAKTKAAYHSSQSQQQQRQTRKASPV